MKKILSSVLALSLLLTVAPAQEKPTVYMVADAHLDTQWNWTVQRTIDDYIYSTLVQNFSLFEQYPEYVFNFEGAVKYAWAKEYYPDLYEKLKGYVARGRWHISGASWDATDWNLPSIESSIRNILYGQKFYEEEFGVKSTDIMLPDCFGFGWTLPSVASHCGLIGFNTQKLQWRNNPFYDDGRKYPFHFGIWQGIDGARIMAALGGGNYTWSPRSEVTDIPELRRLAESSPVGAVFRYFGAGDRGGSVTPEGISYIDAAVRNPGPAYNVRYAATDEMAKKFWMDSRLPVHDGELLMDVHGTGCYTSKVEMKNLNRRNEFALEGAETVAAYADLLGGTSYPKYEIDCGWRRILWHQFHDDLTGTSIPEAYPFSYNDEYLTLRQMRSVTETAVSDIASAMNTSVAGIPVVVYNSVAAVNPSVAKVEIALPEGCKSVEVYSPAGKKVRSQVVPGGETSTVLFAAADPSASLGVYDVRPSSKEAPASKVLKAAGKTIENRIYRVKVNSDGDIESVFDKRCRRELVQPGSSFGLDFIGNNVSGNWPSWEVLKKVVDSDPVGKAYDVKVSVEECGALRAVLKVERRFGESEIIQRIILTDGADDERIDIVNDVCWNSRESLLKAAFRFNFGAPEATYDLGMGNIRRGNNTPTAYEVFGRQWADLTSSDGSYGVTILNDSRYGWDKPADNALRLTLFHTPGVTDRFVYQATQDLGRHTFTYSIVGHKGALDPAAADRRADCLNREKAAFAVAPHPGTLGRSFEMVSSSNPAIAVKALKQAYDGDGIVVRTYELSGKGASAEITFPCEILSAEEIDGIEENPVPAVFSGRTLKVSAKPFALGTYRIRLAAPEAGIRERRCAGLDLPYNTVGITTDAFATQGGIGGEKFSMAAEILPGKIAHEGIGFTFGPANLRNCVCCSGEKIALPEGAVTLHLLVATSKREVRDAAFLVGGKEVKREIGKFTGIYGTYGWPDFYGSSLDSGNVAYVGTHRHAFHREDNTYRFTYLYMIDIPVAGASEVVLPKDRSVFVFAATAVL